MPFYAARWCLGDLPRPTSGIKGGSATPRILKFATCEPCHVVFVVVEVWQDTPALF